MGKKSKSKKKCGSKAGTDIAADIDLGFDYDLVIEDEKLFKQSPPKEDCPICFLRLPIAEGQIMYKSCCGKILCRGCIDAHMAAAAAAEKDTCPFCRTVGPGSIAEIIERLNKRVEANNDAEAMNNIGSYYQRGDYGHANAKALEFYYKAAKLGCHSAHHNLAISYYSGDIVAKDIRKARYHYQLAATGGVVNARYNLGCEENDAGNLGCALKHWIIAANDGCEESMKHARTGYTDGFVTKDELLKTIRAYGNSVDEMKSDDRDRSAATMSS